MPDLRLREMTDEEFDAFRARAIEGYAQAKAEAGEYPPDRAVELARANTEQLLPQGRSTPEMLFLLAESDDDGIVGSAWVALSRPDQPGGWIYDIEVDGGHRGKGYGRALLSALERVVLEHGQDKLALNVFAGNGIARGLYESSGYAPTSLHMAKQLSA